MRPFKYSEGPFLDDWAKEHEAKIAESDDKTKCSLVHASLEANPGFYSEDGPKITRLAMQWIESSPRDRPSMRQVVNRMLKLRIVRKHAKALGFDWKPKAAVHCRGVVYLSEALCMELARAPYRIILWLTSCYESKPTLSPDFSFVVKLTLFWLGNWWMWCLCFCTPTSWRFDPYWKNKINWIKIKSSRYSS